MLLRKKYNMTSYTYVGNSTFSTEGKQNTSPYLWETNVKSSTACCCITTHSKTIKNVGEINIKESDNQLCILETGIYSPLECKFYHEVVSKLICGFLWLFGK